MTRASILMKHHPILKTSFEYRFPIRASLNDFCPPTPSPYFHTLAGFGLASTINFQSQCQITETAAFYNVSHKGNFAMRHVIQRGRNTLTTIGCSNGFESHVRRYSNLGSRDSVEAAIYPYDNDSGPFSKDGNSGSITVDALGKFVPLLTGGTGRTDITFGTPMHWLWDVIKTQFPSASLYIEDDDNYGVDRLEVPL
ncbi:hypothetical protein BDR07DRAFT_1374054 [Suillus spraguei]|nr:hypothetical protein BDR07DRAFT_1374054 [Suillus spraguei]